MCAAIGAPWLGLELCPLLALPRYSIELLRARVKGGHVVM